MNLILLTKEDLSPDGLTAEIRGHKLKHITQIHKAKLDQELTVGILNGNVGKGKVLEVREDLIRMNISLTLSPPPPLPLTLIVALPRPKTLKKVIHAAVSMGAKRIIFIESWKVDKSYWKSPVLTSGEIEEQCHLALEQSKDTVMPEISLKRRFKPFVEDELSELIRGTLPFVAHPYNATPCPTGLKEEVTLAIGPEGGFTDYEIESFKKLNFQVITLGERILRVEFAACSLLSKIF
ncbi:MAG: 16S rRNA (uracil(1498)-N(3))-methyltransferase [Lentisphaerota bacterium]